MNKLQLEILHKQIDKLQKVYGEKTLKPIYGAGNTDNPNLMMIFMNPTAKNISSNINWRGIRAPWIGTKKYLEVVVSSRIIGRKIILQNTTN